MNSKKQYEACRLLKSQMMFSQTVVLWKRLTSYSHLPLDRRLSVWRHFLREWWTELWAAKYTGLGEVEIRQIPDRARVYRIFDYIFQNWMSFDQEKRDYDPSRLNPSEKAVWYAWDVDCEIVNGGFNQYFFNKRSRPTQPILDAYRVLGAEFHYQLFLRAIEDYDHVRESHMSTFQQSEGNPHELLEGFSATYQDNPLNDLDSCYYSIKPPIEEILRNYIRSHAESFTRIPSCEPTPSTV